MEHQKKIEELANKICVKKLKSKLTNNYSHLKSNSTKVISKMKLSHTKTALM
jgi:hypothetical protein